LKIHN